MIQVFLVRCLTHFQTLNAHTRPVSHLLYTVRFVCRIWLCCHFGLLQIYKAGVVYQADYFILFRAPDGIISWPDVSQKLSVVNV